MRKGGPGRFLFLFHVDWRWIKQRPHFLSEEAERRGFRVVVLFKPNAARRSLPENPSVVHRRPLLPLPHSSRHGRITWVTRRLQRSYLALWCMCFRPNVVYLSHPVLGAVLPKRLRSKVRVVYDCMDDAVAMATPVDRPDVATLENMLVTEADYVLASSQHLVNVLQTRYHREVPLVRNGLSPEFLDVRTEDQSKDPVASHRLVALYVGTIGSWLDWDALRVLRDTFPGTVRLVGPRPVAGLVPSGIEVAGPIEHSAVAALLMKSDLLLLPFARDDVAAAVDPLKLYEYVSSRRPIVARYLPELEPFRPFVTFYEQASEIGSAAETALRAARPDADVVRQFLRPHLWSRRWASIEGLLGEEIGRP